MLYISLEIYDRGNNLQISGIPEVIPRMCSVKKVFLKSSKNSQENTCARVSFLTKLETLDCNFIKNNLVLVFFCEFCEIFKNTFFYRKPPMSVSGIPDSITNKITRSLNIICVDKKYNVIILSHFLFDLNC